MVTARGITQESTAHMRLKGEEPGIWLCSVQGDGSYSTWARFTGETGLTWWGGYIAYNSFENSFVIGTHNSATQSTADDKPAMAIARSTGNVYFTDNLDKADQAVTRVHVGDAITLDELSADPADPGSGRFNIWLSDGTGSGDVGDVMLQINNGVSTKITTLVDFSAV